MEDQPYTVDVTTNAPPEVLPGVIVTKLFRFQPFSAISSGGVAWNFAKLYVTLRADTNAQNENILRFNVDCLTDSIGRYTTNHSNGQQDLFTFSLYSGDFMLDNFTIPGIELIVLQHEDHPVVFSYELSGFPRHGRNADELVQQTDRLRYQTSGMCND